MKARDVMTRKVLTVSPDTSILEAVRVMLQSKISGLPVVDGRQNLIGIVTEGNFLRRSEIGTEHKTPRWIEFFMGSGALAGEYVHASGRKVGEVMTRELRTIGEDTPLDEAVDLMERYHIKRLPVVSDDRLVGIVTRSNLMRAIISESNRNHSANLDDASIRRNLLAELQKHSWAPFALIDVTVKDGMLKYSGCISDERQRQAVMVAAENIPGVKSVEDGLVWVEPVSGMAL